MNRNPRRVSEFLISVILVILCTPIVRAQEHCSNSNIDGSYGFQVIGNDAQRGVQYVLSGRFTADGKGHFTGNGSHTISGKFSRFRFTGTYTVEADCSGIATFVYPDGTSAPLDLVIVSDGNEIEFIVAADGPMESGTAKRQFRRRST